MVKLDIEHVLILVIVAFVLYHLMNRCSCFNNGFSVGADDDSCTINSNVKLSNNTVETCENIRDVVDTIDCKPFFPGEWDNLIRVSENCNEVDKICGNSIDVKPPLLRNGQWTIDSTGLKAKLTCDPGYDMQCGNIGCATNSESMGINDKINCENDAWPGADNLEIFCLRNKSLDPDPVTDELLNKYHLGDRVYFDESMSKKYGDNGTVISVSRDNKCVIVRLYGRNREEYNICVDPNHIIGLDTSDRLSAGGDYSWYRPTKS